MADEDNDSTEAPPLNTDVPVEEPNDLPQRLATSLDTVRQQGRGAALSRRALDTAIPYQTTPAARLAGEAKTPAMPDVGRIVNKAPVTSKQLADSPGNAAAFGANDETLKMLSDVEQTFAGDKVRVKQVEANTEEALQQQQQRVDSLWDLVKSGSTQSELSDLRARQVMGATDPDYDIRIAAAKKKLAEIEKIPGPEAVKSTLSMVGSLYEQGKTAAAAGLGVGVGTSLLGTPVAGVPAGIATFHTALSARMGWDAMGSAYDKFLQLKKDDGSPIDQNVARGGAIAVGLVNGLAAEFGLKIIGGQLGNIINKLGGGKVGQNLLEQLIGKAIGNPEFQSALAKIAVAGSKGAMVNEGFSFISRIAEMGAQNVMHAADSSIPQADSSANPWETSGLKQAFLDSTDFNKVWVPGFAMGFTFGGGAAGYGVLKRTGRATEFRDQGSPILSELMQGEARENPERLQDVLHEVQEHHDPEGTLSTVSVPPEQLRALQQSDGASIPDAIERRLQKAEQTGTEAVIPTAEYAAQVKPLPGADKLLGYERFGDTLTLKEEGEVAERVKQAKERLAKDPVEEDTNKIYEDLKAKMTAAGELPTRAATLAKLYSTSLRTLSLERAKSLGVDPTVFEDYAKSPVEVSGGRENAALAFEKKLERIGEEAQREKRREGAPETPGQEAPPKATKTPLQKIQEAFGKTLGETVLAFRVEGKDRPGGQLPEGDAFLRQEVAAEIAKREGKEVVPVYIRPGDVTGAGKGRVKTGPLDAERAIPYPMEILTGKLEHPKGALGYIESLSAGGLEGFNKITRTGYADISTFLHEFGHYIHFQWERLAPERLRAIDTWLGKEPGKELTIEQTEQFVDGLEQFLKDGSAPNKSLIDTFQTVSRWLTGSIKALEPTVTLDPEVRAAYERLFSTQEELDMAGRVLGFDQDVFGGDTNILTPEQMLKHRELMHDAKRDIFSKGYKNAVSEGNRAAGRELASYHAEAAGDVNLSDVNNLYNWLKEGKTLDGREFGLEPKKLAYADVQSEGFDPKDFKGLVGPKSKPFEGYGAGELSAVLGTGETGRELLDRLRRVEPDFKLQTEQRAQDLFNDAHPQWESMGDYARAHGLVAANGAALGKLQRFWTRVLGEKLGKGGGEERTELMLDQTVREYVKDATPKELKPETAYRAEAKATAEMAEAVRKGDLEGAWDASVRAQLNRKLFVKLTKTRAELVDAYKNLKRIADDDPTRMRISRAGPEYLTIIDHLLNGLGLRETPPGLDINQAAGLKPAADASFREALKVLHDRGEVFPLDNMFAEAGGIKKWGQMEMSDLKEVIAAVETAQHLAKQRSLIQWDGKMRSREEVDAQLSAQVLKNAPWEKVEDLSKSDVETTIGQRVKRAVAPLDRPEFMLRWLDGGKLGGIIDRVLTQPIQMALNAAEKVGERTKAAMDAYLRESKREPGDLFQRVPNEYNGKEYSKKEVLMQLAYFGDARNWDVLARGENMTYKNYKSWFQDLINRGVITKGDIEAMNNLVKLTGSFWDKVRETKQKETGQQIDPVAAKPEVWTLPNGENITQDGGYVPTKYDYSNNPGARPVDDKTSLFSPIQVRAGLPKSFTLERSATGVNLPLDLDLRNIASHLSDVIRYTELFDSLTSAKVALEGPEFSRAIREQYGTPFYQQLDAYVKDMARGAGSEVPPGLGGISRGMAFLKYGTNLKLFGWKFSTAIPQLTGAIAGINDVGWKNFAIAMGKAFDPAERARVDKISGEVKTALHMIDAAMPMSAMDQVFKENAPSVFTRSEAHVQNFLKQTAFGWMKWFTRQSSMVNYLGGELKAHEVLAKEAEEALARGEKPVLPGSPEWETRTQHIADQVVRTADSSSSYKDLPQFFRHNKWVWSYLNLAAGYSNNIYNHLRGMGYDFKRGDYSRILGHFLTVVAAPALATALLGRNLFPSATQGRDDPDDWKWAIANGGTAIGQTVIRSVPMAGDLSLDVVKHFIDKTPAKDHLEFFGSRPLNLPLIDDLERFSDHVGTYWARDSKGILHGDEMEKIGFDVFNAAGQIGVPGVGQFPAYAMSNGLKMYLRFDRGELKLNDAEFFKQMIAPGQPYSARGKKK